jgi:hypothetical protein
MPHLLVEGVTFTLFMLQLICQCLLAPILSVDGCYTRGYRRVPIACSCTLVPINGWRLLKGNSRLPKIDRCNILAINVESCPLARAERGRYRAVGQWPVVQKTVLLVLLCVSSALVPCGAPRSSVVWRSVRWRQGTEAPVSCLRLQNPGKRK